MDNKQIGWLDNSLKEDTQRLAVNELWSTGDEVSGGVPQRFSVQKSPESEEAQMAQTVLSHT